MEDTGVQDAAIFLMSLGEEEAAEVFKHLAPKEVQRLGEAIARTRSVSRERVDGVIEKFTSEAASQSLLVSDTDNYVRSVLKRALGEDKAGLLIDRILQGGDVTGIESLKWMDPLSVAELLRNEHPQIMAAILVHLDFEQVAGILKHLTARTRNEVMLRIATLEGIQPAALKDLNEVLFKVLAGGDKVRKASLGGVKTAAEIINLMGTQIETTVIDAIRNHDADLAQKIMDKMFTFEDLTKLDGKSVQQVLKEVSSDSLVVALKGATTELRELILANMSSRAAEGLRDDLESRGPLRLSEVEAQQKEILKVVRRLSDEGSIVIGGGGDDSFVKAVGQNLGLRALHPARGNRRGGELAFFRHGQQPRAARSRARRARRQRSGQPGGDARAGLGRGLRARPGAGRARHPRHAGRTAAAGAARQRLAHGRAAARHGRPVAGGRTKDFAPAAGAGL